MKPEQQRAILEAAAKACGISGSVMGSGDIIYEKNGVAIYWNPLTNSSDTASMCERLEIETLWGPAGVFCIDGQLICADAKHDGTPEGKEAAWRLAASMVAAKVGGFES